MRELAPADVERELALESRVELLKGAFLLGLTRADAEELYAEGLRLARDDVAGRVILTAWYGRTLNGLGDVREYLELARKLIELCEETDDVQARTDAWAIYVDALIFAGFWDDARESVERSLSTLEFAPKVATLPALGLFLFFRVQVWILQGQLDRAREELPRLVRSAAKLDSPDMGYLNALLQVWLAEFAGDRGAALPAARRAAESSEAAGDPVGYRTFVAMGLALAHLATGDWSQAAEAARTKIRLHEQGRVELMEEPTGWVYLAEALLGSGDWADARDAAAKALEQSRERLRQWIEIRALRALALSRARVEGPDADALDSLLDEADAIIARTGAHVLTPRITEARAELSGLRGDTDLQRAQLQEAHRLYAEMAATGHAERLARELEAGR